jgi:NIPSNAP
VLGAAPARRYDTALEPGQEMLDMAFYELRQYKVRPGKMAEWLKIMEEEIIPFQVAKGMVITGSFRGETDDSVYVWLRRFESEGQREALYKAVYESDHWKKEIAPRIPDLLDREKMVVTRIVPTARSTAQ